EELKTFAYSISHDLKAPSNTLDLLLSEIESVHGADLPDEVSHLLDLSHQTVHRMQSLIEDVLDYTRVVGETITLEPVSLDDLVASVVEDQRGAMSDTGAEVDIQRLPAVLGHRTHIRILFQNLISNALKYQQPGARPRIAIAETTRPRDTLCAITVTDNGIGIPANQQERIFNMFQRLYGDETYTGTGLGLAICKRIAVSHGGEISVDSRMGEGSAFTVTLQRA
ncbi:MAG: ATP-binding protein, partial [Pseudomonadota bacterium]